MSVRHAVIIDRTGGTAWRRSNGRSLLTDRGWRITVITDQPTGDLPAGVVEMAIGSFTEERIASALATAEAEQPIDRISTCSEYHLVTAANARQARGLPGHTTEYTIALRDKWEMKQRCRRGGIRCLAGEIASEPADPTGIGDISKGLVLKPRTESGAKGVTLCSDWPALRAAIGELDRPEAYLVEPFCSLPMLHIDGIVHGHRTILQVSRYIRPCHVAGGTIPLSSMTVDDPTILRQAADFMNKIIREWSITGDVIHCEAFWDGTEFIFCEIAGRPGGAGVPEVFRLTKGFDLRHAKTLIDVGDDPFADFAEPVAAHGGWTVHHSPFEGKVLIDDTAVAGHRTRRISAAPDRYVPGFAGVGVATYSFADDDPHQIAGLISAYEKQVRIMPLLHSPTSNTGEAC